MSRLFCCVLAGGLSLTTVQAATITCDYGFRMGMMNVKWGGTWELDATEVFVDLKGEWANSPTPIVWNGLDGGAT